MKLDSGEFGKTMPLRFLEHVWSLNDLLFFAPKLLFTQSDDLRRDKAGSGYPEVLLGKS